MKKIGIILALMPFVALGYSTENLETITLEFDADAHAYNIVYGMDDDSRLVSNLTTTAKTEEKAINRLHNVTKNTPGFEGITEEEVRERFDWESFALRRAVIKSLIDTIVAKAQEQGGVDPAFILKLLVSKELY